MFRGIPGPHVVVVFCMYSVRVVLNSLSVFCVVIVGVCVACGICALTLQTVFHPGNVASFNYVRFCGTHGARVLCCYAPGPHVVVASV